MGWIAPPGYVGNETIGPEPALSPSDRIARALHPLPLFAAATTGGSLLCASCAYMAEQYPQTEQEKYSPNENSPMAAMRFRDGTSQPRQVPPVALEDSAPLASIFNHADQMRGHLQPEGKEGVARESE